MTGHELARKLLDLPDVPVVSGLDRSGSGEEVLVANLVEAHTEDYSVEGFAWSREKYQYIDLILSDETLANTEKD